MNSWVICQCSNVWMVEREILYPTLVPKHTDDDDGHACNFTTHITHTPGPGDPKPHNVLSGVCVEELSVPIFWLYTLRICIHVNKYTPHSSNACTRTFSIFILAHIDQFSKAQCSKTITQQRAHTKHTHTQHRTQHKNRTGPDRLYAVLSKRRMIAHSQIRT